MNSESETDISSLLSENKKEYSKEKFQEQVLEQYKVYAQILDDHHNRFMNTLKFFITIQFAFLYGFSFILKEEVKVGIFGVIMFLISSLIVCIVWFLISKSHQKLTSAKHETLEEMESFMPIRPFSYEWHSKLKSGKNYTSARTALASLPIVMSFIYISISIVYFIYY